MRKILFLFFILLFLTSAGFAQNADLIITQNPGAGPYFQNNLVTFTLTATNAGPEEATNVVLKDVLGPALSFVSSTPAGSTYDAATRTINFLLGSMASGKVVTVTVVAKINDVPGATFTNTASISGTQPDPNVANNNSVSAALPIAALPATLSDLSITKEITAGTAETGENITYTIIARNNGPLAASNVMVTDILPANLTFVSATASVGSYTVANGRYTIGDLALNATTTLIITATVNTSGRFTNTATVSGNPADPDNTNNAFSLETCVLPDAPTRLEINGSATTNQVCFGKTVELKVPVVSGATEYRFSFPASSGFTVVRQVNKGSIIEVTPGPATGIVTIGVQAINACGPSSLLQVPITVSAAPAAPIAINGLATPCSGAEVSYTVAPVPGATTYTWTAPAGWRILSGGTTPSVLMQAGTTPGNITVKTGNTCDNGGIQTLAVTPVLTPLAPTAVIDSSSACNGLKYVINPVSNATKYTWSVPTNWTITGGQGTTTITVTAPDAKAKGLITVVAENGTCTSPVVSFAAEANRGDGLLDFPNAFSPNGDSQNDLYTIGNLSKYPDNDILIINRWGNQVYKKANYQNNWDATGLSDGTYFYVVRVKACKDEQKIFRGSVTIAR